MLEVDNPAFEAGAVWWIVHFASAGVTLGEVHAALDALPAPDVHATLTALLKRHGLG